MLAYAEKRAPILKSRLAERSKDWQGTRGQEDKTID